MGGSGSGALSVAPAAARVQPWPEADRRRSAPPAAAAAHHIDLLALSTRSDLSAAELLGQPVLLELLTSGGLANAVTGGDWRPFHGHVTRFAAVYDRLSTGGRGGSAASSFAIRSFVHWLSLAAGDWLSATCHHVSVGVSLRLSVSLSLSACLTRFVGVRSRAQFLVAVAATHPFVALLCSSLLCSVLP